MVTWARDAFFFSFFLGLTAFGGSAVGAPSHPTMCELAPALVCLHTWIPMMRIGGTGGPGFGWHCATRGPVWGGFAWAGDWLQFWILLARFHCQSLPLRSREGCKCPCCPLLPSRMYTKMKNMFMHVFQGWALDVQPNISEPGVLDCHEDPLGLPSAQESQSELFRLLTGESLHVLALETRCTTKPFLQARVSIHYHSTIHVMLGGWKEVNSLEVVA